MWVSIATRRWPEFWTCRKSCFLVNFWSMIFGYFNWTNGRQGYLPPKLPIDALSILEYLPYFLQHSSRQGNACGLNIRISRYSRIIVSRFPGSLVTLVLGTSEDHNLQWRSFLHGKSPIPHDMNFPVITSSPNSPYKYFCFPDNTPGFGKSGMKWHWIESSPVGLIIW